MFKIGDTVYYGTTGVCRIEEVSMLSLGREKKQYYILRPIAQGGSAVFVPTDNQLLLDRMRAVMAKEDVESTIDRSLHEADIWSDNANERIRLFADVIKNGDCIKLLVVLRTILNHKKEAAQNGKKLHISDEKTLRDVQRLLSDELSYALGTDHEQTERLIMTRISNDS